LFFYGLVQADGQQPRPRGKLERERQPCRTAAPSMQVCRHIPNRSGVGAGRLVLALPPASFQDHVHAAHPAPSSIPQSPANFMSPNAARRGVAQHIMAQRKAAWCSVTRRGGSAAWRDVAEPCCRSREAGCHRQVCTRPSPGCHRQYAYAEPEARVSDSLCQLCTSLH
jgi:hypothetical protein